jgi:hypothetical protein
VRPRRLATRVLLVVPALLLASAGCGGESTYDNRPRPPAPINITAAITDRAVQLSPTSVGAGPVVVTVSNLSPASQVATIEVDDVASSSNQSRRAGLRQSTGPINPQDTAEIKVAVEPDTTYTLKTDDDKIDPAKLTVGRERPSSQNDLLLP